MHRSGRSEDGAWCSFGGARPVGCGLCYNVNVLFSAGAMLSQKWECSCFINLKTCLNQRTWFHFERVEKQPSPKDTRSASDPSKNSEKHPSSFQSHQLVNKLSFMIPKAPFAWSPRFGCAKNWGCWMVRSLAEGDREQFWNQHLFSELPASLPPDLTDEEVVVGFLSSFMET